MNDIVFHIDTNTTVYVYGFSKQLEELENEVVLSSDELLIYRSFKSDKRKIEWLTVRYYINSVLGGNYVIAYNSNGAPFIVNDSRYISISHFADGVAIMVSDRVCGVDIESTQRDYKKVQHKYTNKEEIDLCGDVKFPLPYIWCAKEAAYKAAGINGADFKKDIVLKSQSLIKVCDMTFSVGGMVNDKYSICWVYPYDSYK